MPDNKDNKPKPVPPRTPSGQRPAVSVPRSDGTPSAPRVASVNAMAAVRPSTAQQVASPVPPNVEDTIRHVSEAPPAIVQSPEPPPVAPKAPSAGSIAIASGASAAATPSPAPVVAAATGATHALSESAMRAAAKAAAAEVVAAEIAALATRLTRIEDQLKKLAERDVFTAKTPPPPIVATSGSATPAPSIAPAPWHVPVSESVAPPAATPSVPPPRPRMSSIPIALPTKVELSADLESALDGSKRRRRTATIVVLILIGLVGGLVAMMLASQIKA